MEKASAAYYATTSAFSSSIPPGLIQITPPSLFPSLPPPEDPHPRGFQISNQQQQQQQVGGNRVAAMEEQMDYTSSSSSLTTTHPHQPPSSTTTLTGLPGGNKVHIEGGFQQHHQHQPQYHHRTAHHSASTPQQQTTTIHMAADTRLRLPVTSSSPTTATPLGHRPLLPTDGQSSSSTSSSTFGANAHQMTTMMSSSGNNVQQPIFNAFSWPNLGHQSGGGKLGLESTTMRQQPPMLQQYQQSVVGQSCGSGNGIQMPLPSAEDIAVNSRIPLPTRHEPPIWCSLYYYEMSERVGEPYHCERFSLYNANTTTAATSPSTPSTSQQQHQQHLSHSSHLPRLDEVHIDGLCAPSDGRRFCLGILSHGDRSPQVLATRRQIGKGCRLYALGNTGDSSDIYLQCLGGSPIFVQAPLYAWGLGDNLATVYRLSNGSTIKLFDRQHFNRLLAEAGPRGYDAVYSLLPMCQTRISFVKGWGERYRRQTITSTPCWVEAQFTLPLQALDKVLMEVRAPDEDEVHSFT